MALQINWTPEAIDQLNKILEYWIERNQSTSYSQKLYETFKNVISILSKYPESGFVTSQNGVRCRVIKDYYLFYSFNDTYLTILGFCDSRRDPNFIKTLI